MLDTLTQIVESTPGAKGAILMGLDGIVVEQYVAEEHADTDIESMAMEFSFRFIELREAATSLEMGELNDIAVKAEYGTFMARMLTGEYFVGLLMGEPGHFGKGRWMLRSTAATFLAELA
jgi:predicted regulator of Ras-like GTPase activity (Roadblock/LC7/MglB family)